MENDAAPPSMPHARSNVRLDGLKVLLVEDEDDSRELLVHVLSDHGAQVTACGSVQEFVRRFPEVRPDVLVSDIAMPGADGFELMRWLRELPAEDGGLTPAIAVTAHARKGAREEALRAGFQRHAAKPIDVEDLVLTVAELGGVGLLPAARSNSVFPPASGGRSP
jgi:CheY-like chemotaxis protein